MVSGSEPASAWFQWASEKGSFWEVVARQSNSSHPMGPLVGYKEDSSAIGGSVFVSVGTMLSSAHLGLLTGVLVTLYLRHKHTRMQEEMAEMKAYNAFTSIKFADVRRLLFVVVTFLEFLLLSPLFLSVYYSFKCYRFVVTLVLKRRYGPHFKGLLDGADVVWAVERENSRGMINMMAFIEEPANELVSLPNSTVSAELLIVLRKRISSRLMRSYRPHPKMFWKRSLALGYYYWSDLSELTIEDYIRYLEPASPESGELLITKRQLRSLMSKINNRQLPGNHTSSWEILVGKQPLLDKERNVLRFPIIARVHHSLGDGVALLRLLLEGIVDKDGPSRWQRLSNFKVMNLDYILKEQPMPSTENERLGSKLIKSIPSAQQICAWKRRQLQILWTIFTAPAFFHEMVLRKVDENSIHACELSNEKVVSWIHESEWSTSNWVEIIKRTKQQLPGARFSDAFLTALSASLAKYFKTKSYQVPECVTVVLPTRIERESAQLRLQNRFSVGLQTLPIASGISFDQPHQHANLLHRLAEVKQYSDTLRSSPDYLINYWIMSTVASLFPDQILSKILTSAHSTLVISNLPGPQQKPRIHGYELKDLGFWIPNVGQTSVGISLLTYGGKMQLGILADRAVIRTEEDAHSILEETVAEIKRMGSLLDNV